MGLGACSASPKDQVTEDQIVDKKSFLRAYEQCDRTRSPSPTDELTCVKKIFADRTNEYCIDNNSSPSSLDCLEIRKRVEEKVVKYHIDNTLEMIKTVDTLKNGNRR
jgi:hypothetical protein